jgi:hypothetical protein
MWSPRPAVTDAAAMMARPPSWRNANAGSILLYLYSRARVHIATTATATYSPTCRGTASELKFQRPTRGT